MIAWSDAYHNQAVVEGWWLSTRDDGYYEIQRLDEDPAQRFESDEQAHKYVRAQAEAGSLIHLTALRLHGTEIQNGWR
jgi:hypothetical protein